MKKITNRTKARTYLVIGYVLAMCGFLMSVGGIGSIDFADEIGEMLTGRQELYYYMTSFAGIGIAFIGAKLVLYVDRWQKRQARRRRKVLEKSA